MQKQKLRVINMSSLLLTLSFLLSSHVRSSSAGGSSGKNPFSPKAYLIRYWNNRIYRVPPPDFLFNKASPLSASDSSRFAQLAAKKSLSTHLDSFCKAASLFCFPDPSTSSEIDASTAEIKGKKVTKRWVEPVKFFREKMLKEGTVMPMPDIKDKMPPRSFLPRLISSKLPFSSSKISQLKEIFHAFDNSLMESILNSALHECHRGASSPGKTKKLCVGSIEDMIDFTVSVLGHSVEPRTTQNANGSKTDILIGKVKGVNGGKVTRSVSCHQSLYPYLLYYCHSVRKGRVYEADILDPKSKEKINHGVAICHLDTSVWSPTHGAFRALGRGPGKTGVCHWILENDLIWTIAS